MSSSTTTLASLASSLSSNLSIFKGEKVVVSRDFLVWLRLNVNVTACRCCWLFGSANIFPHTYILCTHSRYLQPTHMYPIYSYHNYTVRTYGTQQQQEKSLRGKTNSESHVFAVTILSLHRFDDAGSRNTLQCNVHETTNDAAAPDAKNKFNSKKIQVDWRTLKMVFLLALWRIDVACVFCSALQILARIESPSNFVFDGLDSLIFVHTQRESERETERERDRETEKMKKNQQFENRF